jgi:acetyl-CoA C-acetyltransferase
MTATRPGLSAPNTPVIVGIGFTQEKHEDPATCSEPYRLMVQAVRRAAEDAGTAASLEQIESIAVPQGGWDYRNPGALIRDALGCPSARSILADLGVLQLSPLSDLCRAIAAGEQHVGVVTGGEAKYRVLRGTLTGQPVADTEQPEDTPPPDVHQTSADPWCSDLEAQRGISSPIEFFAIIESALRHRRGIDVERHRDDVAALYARFSAIAARNPHAWRREPVTADVIRDASPKNAMLAFPYTKLHSTQWNVNQAVAIIVCSTAHAAELGLRPEGWIYPLAAAQSKRVIPLAQQRRLDSHPGTVLCGERVLALAGVSAGDVTAAELYSCFPAAVQSFAQDLRLDESCPWTVTGGMSFAGGPFNSASLEGVARMVEVLRAEATAGPSARRIGLVSNLSGIFGKQACALFSNEPNPDGYRFEDVTAAVAERDVPLPLAGDHTGPATIAGYTVVFAGGVPSHAIAVCDTPGGERTVVRTEDGALLEAMTREEFCGRVIEVTRGGGFRRAPGRPATSRS